MNTKKRLICIGACGLGVIVLVADLFTHLRGFGSEGYADGIADGNEVFR